MTTYNLDILLSQFAISSLFHVWFEPFFSWPTYRFLRRQVGWSSIPNSKNVPQFVVIHIVKGFCIVTEAQVDVYWNSLAFSMIHQRFAFWSQLPLPFLNPTCISGSYLFTYRSEVWRVLNITLLICEMGIINSNYLLILSWIKQVPDAYLFSGLASLQRKEAILLNKWFVCGSQWVRGWPVSLFVF